MMDTQTPTRYSGSHIKVWCSDNADPKCNRLQLNTNPPTYIELQPGLNILTVEEYPALRYGFFQLQDEEGVWNYENGHEILGFDFSNFDGTELQSMSHMFAWMSGVRKIIFGKMHTPSLENTDCAFYRTGENTYIESLDLSGIDFSKVSNADYMFYGIKAKCVNLSNCDFSSLVDAEAIFEDSEIEDLILNNVKLPEDISFI